MHPLKHVARVVLVHDDEDVLPADAAEVLTLVDPVGILAEHAQRRHVLVLEPSLPFFGPDELLLQNVQLVAEVVEEVENAVVWRPDLDVLACKILQNRLGDLNGAALDDSVR